MKVELISQTLERKESPVKYISDMGMQPGSTSIVQKGHTGYKSKLIKKVYENGKLIKTETVSQDKYLAAPTIIRQGI
ncbi:hypothetical protein GOM49_05835 [Clostridium bovifaecis]|uniref:G5 domain-containing protein n=1 Tax=Clostridium bovifaecis TaxID=2184719 RepID=A0A6I6ELV4_9CLOT|nr:hypothetical protein GOM49_05835 [Clostridium bovifaecis]